MEELVVGYLLPSTGALAFLNEPMVRAVEMALDEINAAGGRVRLISGDSGSSADVASTTVDDLLADSVSAIVGAAASGISLSVLDKVSGAEVVMIAPSNTSPTFTTYDDGGYYFRTSPSDVLRAQVLADLVTEDGVTDVGIVYRADDYGRNLAAELESRLTDNGVNIKESIAYDPVGASFVAEIHQLLESGVNGIVLIAFSEGAKIIAGMIEAEIGPSDIPLFLGDGIAGDSLWKSVDATNPAVLVGAKVAAPSSAPEDGEPTFPARFLAFVGDDDAEMIYSPQAYDALVIVALASRAAGSTMATDFVGEINDVTRGGTKCSSYAACVELISAGEDIDYDGASGPLEFTESGEPSVVTYDISGFNAEGKREVIDQIAVAIN